MNEKTTPATTAGKYSVTENSTWTWRAVDAGVTVMRIYQWGVWLVSVCVHDLDALGPLVRQCRAVMDDFGSLVPVGDWK